MIIGQTLMWKQETQGCKRQKNLPLQPLLLLTPFFLIETVKIWEDFTEENSRQQKSKPYAL